MRYLKRFAAVVTAFMMIFCFSVQGYAANSNTSVSNGQKYITAKPASLTTSGVYTENQSVKLVCGTSGARIFYTTDGTKPTVYSREYDAPIRVKGIAGETTEITIRAIAVKTGYQDSEELELNIVIQIPAQLDVEYMEIHRVPDKTIYNKGEELNVNGGEIIVTYEDGSIQTMFMTKGMISGFNSNTAGVKTLTVTYNGFKDHFDITVNDADDTSSGGGSYYPDDEDYEDMRAKIKGTDYYGWTAIAAALEDEYYGVEVVIRNNGSFAVPAEVIRAAASNELVLVFELNDEMFWTLDTTKISAETPTGIGVGVRTNAIYIPDTYVRALGGEATVYLHINSNNKLGASLSLNSRGLSSYIASLFRYDSETHALQLVDSSRVGMKSMAEFIPEKSGDYVVIVDAFSKLPGDLDNDLQVTSLDAARLLKLLVTGGTDDIRADVDGDGFVTAFDVAEVLRRVVL